ncbi:MAG: adenylate/guanylate cyclase domain-containing protein [Nocardioidaceae bacterium]
MTALPTGTVSLVFSDIEGSTVLLSRLGLAYAEALDGQRQVLRKAWAEHGGVELGTEGDSFFVVFPTADEAVAAAAQAQRELNGYPWPGGQQVRVRMGIHTGSPTVHDGGYVGMDVHRAARIAGAAHGGQVVLSEATAKLVSGCLPERVGLRELGSYQVKDIASPERLFQLAIEGLPSDFAPLKTLGAASSLPRPATPLVGRDGELAELTARLSSPDVRLLTLTGTGGSGKTRLAIAVAQNLVERFPDGVYFAPLAAVTTEEVMWTSIAEVLDLPPEGRIPPGFFDHVAHRRALFVLDNLEQIEAADVVVGELLAHAAQAVVIATTRKPLAVEAEHVHPVPPLQLPERTTLEHAETSGAVQLFVQHARKHKPAFRLTSGNVADVAEVCRRLDGLPLAIELAAARVRLLSPKALLSRLDQALDLTAAGRHGPARQQTLRDTMAWSYQLLDPTQQAFFRRLGVFAGGADLVAIAAVSNDILDGADPLDLVAQLSDASLLIVSEQRDGEPRVQLLSTVRDFAVERLTQAGERQSTQYRHAQFYLALAESVGLQFLLTGRQLATHGELENEHGNFREVLAWAFTSDGKVTEGEHVRMGLRMATSLSLFWMTYGYPDEGRRWLETGIQAGAQQSSPEMAAALEWLANFLDLATERARVRELFTLSLAMSRRVGDGVQAAEALVGLAKLHQQAEDLGAARQLLDEALTLAKAAEASWLTALKLCWVLEAYADLELHFGTPDRALVFAENARAIAVRHGIEAENLRMGLYIAWALALAGRGPEALAQVHDEAQPVIDNGHPLILAELMWAYSAALAVTGYAEDAAKLQGAYQAALEQPALASYRLTASDEALAERCYVNARPRITAEAWAQAQAQGRSYTVRQAIAEARQVPTSPPPGIATVDP